ncbi:MAG TPA: sensor histidine kinase [Ruminococcaceae bacterium]|nr:sensor histidine kinase [Oscillospiraceae bacterium]
MKAFNRLFAAVLGVLAVIFLGANLFLIKINGTDGGRPYMVEINRLALKIEQGGLDSLNPSDFKYVTDIAEYGEDFYKSESDYAVREINGRLYRFDYRASDNGKAVIAAVNAILGIMSVFIITAVLYVKIKIILPFDRLKNLPYELSKGNLTLPLKESKSRFFSRFIWGVDLLRENMEKQKKREIELQREKKTLLLSLSHDIKTPLSAIKLYAKAISKGLYPEKEKQREIAESINLKADEIESYVSRIITASREDFLSMEVKDGEFYLNALVTDIKGYYSEKLSLIKTDFEVGRYEDCLIKGDIDRSIEVIQNIMENAVKYGDGKSIYIDFGEEDNCILISVKNSGSTLSASELPHIFESFWRGSNSERQGGSGLGLYICRQLMHKMGGDIFAEINGEFITVTAVFVKA